MNTSLLIWLAVILAVLAFVYRFFTNPFFLARVLRFFLRMRYKLVMDGFDEVMRAERLLIMPNHPAYIDPILLFEEIYARGRKVSPMTDEQFFANPVFRQVLGMSDAVMVPDLMKHRSEAAVRQAASLVQISVNALEEGRSLVFYPSGHVTLDGKETLGARRLAYETVCAINDSPEDSPLRQVRLFLLRTRGLETSRWSKSRTRVLNKRGAVNQDALPWSFSNPGLLSRRLVRMHFEDMTDQLQEWARTYDKSDFNKQLEAWYNQDN